MEAAFSINTILAEAKKLSKEEQLTLLQRLVLLLQKLEATQYTTPRLTALTGLGSELWQNAQVVDSYLEEERQW